MQWNGLFIGCALYSQLMEIIGSVSAIDRIKEFSLSSYAIKYSLESG